MSPRFFLPFPSESLHLTRSFIAAETKQRPTVLTVCFYMVYAECWQKPMRKVFIRLKLRHKRPNENATNDRKIRKTIVESI